MNDLIFHVSFLFAAASMIRYLSVFYFFSVLTFMLKRMKKWTLTRNELLENYSMRSNHSLAWMIFQKGAFEIFGEVDDGDKSGSLPGCVDITWMSVWRANSNDMYCLFRTTLVPITVFTYMIVASIMLLSSAVVVFLIMSGFLDDLSLQKERRSKFHSKVRELIDNSPIEENAGLEECIEHAQMVLHKIFDVFADTINKEIGQIKK
ncbi:unnamed protein product [Angiostrongylus costaricensis]|uniref:Ion_trans domain-containing protein n=1 Tax=Angiostrongylus costaricensis TaxID=334426 RepID=A0A158PDY2_ANGCS|nr:unnamed protein product [Angiostrongylus costaricensis]